MVSERISKPAKANQQSTKTFMLFARKGGSTATPLTNPRGQIKMFETVGVLVVFFFLLAIGSIFYFGAQQSALKKDRVAASEQYALQIVLKSLYLPELDCSFLVTQKDNCIDQLKLEHFQGLLMKNEDAQEDYFTEFGYATITVTEAYPGNSTTTMYSNIPNEYTGKLSTQSPILLYNAINDSYAFGIIEVNVYV